MYFERFSWEWRQTGIEAPEDIFLVTSIFVKGKKINKNLKI